jgi:hypothetical protein
MGLVIAMAFMSDPFASSHRKISRAKKHLADLDRKTKTFFSRPDLYKPFVEAHPEMAGHTVLKIRFIEELPKEFEEIAGEILYNLRSALDHAVYGAALAFSKPTNPKLGTACFPFASDAAKFENALKGRCASVPIELYPIFRDCKPYKGGNELLWALNTIRGTDEHAIFVPAVTAAFVGGMEIDTIGWATMPYRPTLDSSKNEMEICTLAPGTKFHGNLQLAMYIAFGEVESVAGKNAGDTFQLFTKLVATIVSKIETESKRLGIVK